MKPLYRDQAARELADRDPVLRELIARFPGIALERRGDAFATLARAIVGQQISVKAAESVWQRVVAAVGNVAPPAVCERSEVELRAAGLSRQKVAYLRGLAGHFLDGYNHGRSVPLRRLRTLGRAWAPWRSVATWYLWRSLDPIPVEY